jgi:hypothetical protein
MQFSHVTIDGSSIGICGLNMHCAMSFQLQKRPKRIPFALLQGSRVRGKNVLNQLKEQSLKLIRIMQT